MEKPQRPSPPEHRAYPRGTTPPPPPKRPAPQRIPLWSRAVPADRSFPRA